MAQLSQVGRREGAPHRGGGAVQVGLAGKLVNAARVIEKSGDFRLFPERGVLVDGRAVSPEIAAGRLEPDELQMVLHVLACGGKKLSQDVRHGQQRRPHAPAKAIDAQVLRLAARLGVALPHLDRVPLPREPDGGRESAQAGADNEDFVGLAGHRGRWTYKGSTKFSQQAFCDL